MWTTRLLGVVVSIFALTSCGGGNRWGYGRAYEALDGQEEDLMETAQELPLEDIRRDPAAHRSTMLSWFGIVTDVSLGPGGRSRVRLAHRTHTERHLCSDRAEDTCRVTVSERSTGDFTALITLRPEDSGGELRLWTGSLVRVYGRPTGDFDEDGNPVVRASWYRHWPHGQYVTTAAREYMRR